jgi:hypothetical protein
MTPIHYVKSKNSSCHMTSAEICEEATNEQGKKEEERSSVESSV